MRSDRRNSMKMERHPQFYWMHLKGQARAGGWNFFVIIACMRRKQEPLAHPDVG